MDEEKRRILVEQILAHRSRARSARAKQRKALAAIDRLNREISMGKAVDAFYTKDDHDVRQQLDESDQLLATFRRAIAFKKEKFKHQHEILADLKRKIQQQTVDVKAKIQEIEDAVLEWQAANFILDDHIRVANYIAAERFQHWHQTVPLFQSWLSLEDKAHYSIYSTATYAGFHDELQAYSAMREQIQDFAELAYKDLGASKFIPQLKQLNEQRLMRSEAFDQMHTKMLKQLRQALRQCDTLQTEIQERERARAQLLALTMDLNIAVEDDFLHAMQHCDEELQRSMEHVMNELKGYSPEERKIISRTYIYLAHSLNGQVFRGLTPEGMDIFLRHHQEVVENLDLYESEPSPTTQGKDKTKDTGSIVSDITDSFAIDSRRTVIPLPGAKKSARRTMRRINEGEHSSEPDDSVKDANEIVARFRDSLEEIKRRLAASKTKKLLKHASVEIAHALENILPTLMTDWKSLMNPIIDEQEDCATLQLKSQWKNAPKKYQHRSNLENLLFSQCKLNEIQMGCSLSTLDVINTVSNLLDKISAKSEFFESLRIDDSMSLKDHVENEGHSQDDRIQFVTAQQLIDKVTETISKQKLCFEEWMTDGALYYFQSSKQSLQSVLTPSDCDVPSTDNAAADRVGSSNSPRLREENLAGMINEDNQNEDDFDADRKGFSSHEDVNAVRATSARVKFHQFSTFSEDERDKEGGTNSKTQGRVSRSRETDENSSPDASSTMPSMQRMNSDGAIVSGFGEDKDAELSRVEILMKGDRFTMTMLWCATERKVRLILRQDLESKIKFMEYKMWLDLDLLTKLINCPNGLVINKLFTETARVSQQLSHGLQLEQIDQRFYQNIVGSLIIGGEQVESPNVDIKMYIPARRDRRASVLHHNNPTNDSEAFPKARRSLSRGSFIAGSIKEAHSGETNGLMEHLQSAVDLVDGQPYGYLLKVLTLRSKSGLLMNHAFPFLFSNNNNAP